ncbi:hypothetical protein NDK25_07535 [Niallia taxi]|nr:hypothetical protein [Niallia taxi]MDE5052259.1 hypothetical protein [Niallia taxi]
MDWDLAAADQAVPQKHRGEMESNNDLISSRRSGSAANNCSAKYYVWEGTGNHSRDFRSGSIYEIRFFREGSG